MNLTSPPYSFSDSSLEPLVSEDLGDIRTLQPDGWPDISVEFKTYIEQDFCQPIKVVHKNRIIGLGAAIAYGSSGWLAHVIVDPAHRNRGIGREITSALMRILKEKGKNTLLLIATESGYPVYVKAGFRKVSEYVFLLRTSDWPAHITSDHIVPFDRKYRNDVLELDRATTGEDRSVLIGSKLSSSLLYVKGGSVQGYYIPGAGEGTIAALSETAGIELMKAKHAKADRAVLPSENVAAIEFLKGNGFDDSGARGIRMILGERLSWQPTRIFSRIGGNYG